MYPRLQPHVLQAVTTLSPDGDHMQAVTICIQAVTVPVQSPMREHLSAPGELREAHGAAAGLASCQVAADPAKPPYLATPLQRVTSPCTYSPLCLVSPHALLTLFLAKPLPVCCQVAADRGYWEQLAAARTHSHSAVLAVPQRATPGLHAWDWAGWDTRASSSGPLALCAP